MQLDPTRLVEDNSPNGRDHVRTDLNSWHFYIDDYQRSRAHIEEMVGKTFPGSGFNYLPRFRQGTEPLINSEYGTVSAGGGDRDISWGFRYLTTELRRHEKIQGYIYTELTDIEFEHNGFVNYDRSAKEYGYDAFVPGMTVADLQQADFIGFDAPPALEAEPGGTVRIPLFVSHFSTRKEAPTLRTWITGVDDLGEEFRVEGPSATVTWAPYRVVSQPPLTLTLPKGTPPEGRNFVGAVGMELVDGDGKRIAANFVNVIARRKDPDLPGSPRPDSPRPDNLRIEKLGRHRTALRFSPTGFAASRWEGPGSPPLSQLVRAGEFFGYGTGTLEYRLPIPPAVLEAGPVRLELRVELATKARDERLDWPQQTRPVDYPQTDGVKFPVTVHVKIAGQALPPVRLPDDPADARGVLSHQRAYHHGSYGYLVKREVNLQSLPQVTKQLQKNSVIRVIFEVRQGAAG